MFINGVSCHSVNRQSFYIKFDIDTDSLWVERIRKGNRVNIH